MIKHTAFKHGWWYFYRVHTQKTEGLADKFPELKQYLSDRFISCPNEYFEVEPRSSKLRFSLSNLKITHIPNHEVATLARRLGEAVAAGIVRDQPLETMAQVLLGALNTAARVIATAPDPAAARLQVEETIERLLKGLALSDVSA